MTEKILTVLRSQPTISIAEIAVAAGVSKATVKRAIKVLVGSGRLRTEPRSNSCERNTYVIIEPTHEPTETSPELVSEPSPEPPELPSPIVDCTDAKLCPACRERALFDSQFGPVLQPVESPELPTTELDFPTGPQNIPGITEAWDALCETTWSSTEPELVGEAAVMTWFAQHPDVAPTPETLDALNRALIEVPEAFTLRTLDAAYQIVLAEQAEVTRLREEVAQEKAKAIRLASRLAAIPTETEEIADALQRVEQRLAHAEKREAILAAQRQAEIEAIPEQVRWARENAVRTVPVAPTVPASSAPSPRPMPVPEPPPRSEIEAFILDEHKRVFAGQMDDDQGWQGEPVPDNEIPVVDVEALQRRRAQKGLNQ